MTWLDKAIVAVSNIGKGLVINPITNLLDVMRSTDANNRLRYGSDNGLFVPELISGTDIKTIDGRSILGPGNILTGGTTIPYGATKFTVDFGTVPVYDKSFIITMAGATTDSIAAAFEIPTSDEYEMDGVYYSASVTALNEVTVYAHAYPGPIKGERELGINIIQQIATPLQPVLDDAMLQDIIFSGQ